MAVCDANSRFININVGGYGSEHDSAVFEKSKFGQLLKNNQLNLPESSMVGGVQMPYVFISDDAFPIGPHLIKPYPKSTPNPMEQTFNRRLSRARLTIEKSFGMLSNRFLIFQKLIHIEPEKVKLIATALCILHNILIDRNRDLYGFDDEDNIDATQWENVNLVGMRTTNIPFQNLDNNRSANNTIGKNIRNNFTIFFNSPEGSLHFVNNENNREILDEDDVYVQEFERLYNNNLI